MFKRSFLSLAIAVALAFLLADTVSAGVIRGHTACRFQGIVASAVDTDGDVYMDVVREIDTIESGGACGISGCFVSRCLMGRRSALPFPRFTRPVNTDMGPF